MISGQLFDHSGVTLVASKKVSSKKDRRYLMFQNVSDTDMWINFGAAASAANGSILVKTGTSPLFYESGFIPADDLYVFCTLAGKGYTLKES